MTISKQQFLANANNLKIDNINNNNNNNEDSKNNTKKATFKINNQLSKSTNNDTIPLKTSFNGNVGFADRIDKNEKSVQPAGSNFELNFNFNFF